MGKRRGVYRVLVRKPEGKRPLGRSRRRWEDNIKVVLKEVGGGGMNRTDRLSRNVGKKLPILAA